MPPPLAGTTSTLPRSPTSSSPTVFSSSPPKDDFKSQASGNSLSAGAVASRREHRPSNILIGGRLPILLKGAAADARYLGEDELGRMGKDELLRLLRAEWEKKDRTAAVIADLEATRDSLQATNDYLSHTVARHGDKEAEAEAERGRLEDELEGKIALVSRLRERADALEKDQRSLSRRYAEQTTSFDAERQALYDNEQHLKSRLRTIMDRQSSPVSRTRTSSTCLAPSPFDAHIPSISIPTEPSPVPLSEDADRLTRQIAAKDSELEGVKDDLETLERGYNSLQQAMDHSNKELADLKQVNAQLQEDIESYDLLLTERTMSGAMRSNTLLSRSYARNGNAHADSLHSVDEEGQAGELDPNLIPTSQPSSATRSAFAVDSAGLDPEYVTATDDEANSVSGDESSRQTLKIQGEDWLLEKAGARRKVKGESLGDYAVTGSGMDLAAELGRAEADVDEGGLRKLDKGDDGDALRAEVKSLREANKALALYTSKILDRILSVDGFENVLNADAGNSLQGSIRRTSGTQRGSASTRPSVMQPSTFTPVAEPPPAALLNSQPDASAGEKKTRRSSIDWRGGFASLFGTSSASPTVSMPPAAAPSSRLKPLSLSTSPLLTSPPRERLVGRPVSDRRITTTDEVEEDEDRLQRRRVALLQHQLQEDGGFPARPTTHRRSDGSRRKSSVSSGLSYRSSTSPSIGTPPVRPEPIDSLASHIGASETASYFPSLNPAGLGPNERVTDDFVAARLRALDEDEQRKAAEIASGRAGGYSAPSRRASISSHSRRTSASTSRRASEASQRSSDERKWLENGQKSDTHDTLFHFGDGN